MEQLAFDLKDLIIIGSVLIPAILAVAYMKWKQTVLEVRMKEIEANQNDFKKHIYQKLDENSNNLHKIELSIANMKTEFLGIILKAINKNNK